MLAMLIMVDIIMIMLMLTLMLLTMMCSLQALSQQFGLAGDPESEHVSLPLMPISPVAG